MRRNEQFKKDLALIKKAINAFLKKNARRSKPGSSKEKVKRNQSPSGKEERIQSPKKKEDRIKSPARREARTQSPNKDKPSVSMPAMQKKDSIPGETSITSPSDNNTNNVNNGQSETLIDKTTLWDDRELVDLVEAAGFAGISLKRFNGFKEKYEDFPRPVATKAVTGTEDAYDIDHIDSWLRDHKLIKPARVISMINLKGGVGKTTTSVGLATVLTGVYNKKVLFIDLDPQTNGTIMLTGERNWSSLNKEGKTLATLFQDALEGTHKFKLEDVLQRSVSGIEEVKTLDLLPSSLELIDIQDRLITASPGVHNTNKPKDILKRGIRPLLYNYDYILIDCPPNMGLITQNGINISDSYLIPTIPDVLSTYGIPQIISRISEFSDSNGLDIRCLGIIATKFRTKFPLHIRTLDELKAEKDAHLFKTIFPENNQIAEAAEYQHTNTIRQKWGYQGQFDLLTECAKELISLSSGPDNR